MYVIRILFCCVLIMLCVPAYAQQGTNAGGGNATGSGGSASYTIGQVDYINSTGTGGNVNQGVQQPYEIFVTTGVEHTEIQLQASLHPNPTQDYVILSVNQPEHMSYVLCDLQGQVIQENVLSGKETTITLDHVSAGSYYIRVMLNKITIKTFKLIKL